MQVHSLMYGGIPVSAASEMGKELLKWERKPDYNPDNHPYPQMLYRAIKGDDGKVRCMDSERPQFQLTPDQARVESDRVAYFNRKCQTIVNNYEEHMEFKNNGWREGPDLALVEFERREKLIGNAAAERNYQDRNMSELAKVEIAEAEASTPEHLPVIPEKKKLGRPRKVIVAV